MNALQWSGAGCLQQCVMSTFIKSARSFRTIQERGFRTLGDFMRGLCANPNGRRGVRALRSALLANLFFVSTVPSYAAGELPTGGQVVAGSGAIAAAGNALTV